MAHHHRRRHIVASRYTGQHSTKLLPQYFFVTHQQVERRSSHRKYTIMTQLPYDTYGAGLGVNRLNSGQNCVTDAKFELSHCQEMQQPAVTRCLPATLPARAQATRKATGPVHFCLFSVPTWQSKPEFASLSFRGSRQLKVLQTILNNTFAFCSLQFA